MFILDCSSIAASLDAGLMSFFSLVHDLSFGEAVLEQLLSVPSSVSRPFLRRNFTVRGASIFLVVERLVSVETAGDGGSSVRKMSSFIGASKRGRGVAVGGGRAPGGQTSSNSREDFSGGREEVTEGRGDVT